MNVTMEKNGNVSGVITITLTEPDYQDKVKKDLKTIGQKHPIDGFRAGKVPEGILRKMFGKQVLADVINRETVDALFKYIEDNKLSILGEPLPVNEKEADLTQKEYTFSFEVGFAPAVELKLDKDVKIPYYNIKVDDAMIDRQSDMFRRRFGKQEKGETVDNTALVKGSVVELNEDGSFNEGGIFTENTIISMEYLANTDEGTKFLGKKVGDKVVFNPAAAGKNNPAEIASMLNISKEEAANVKSNFQFTIAEIIVLTPAELNQEFFDGIFGPGAVKDEKEYRAKLAEMIAAQLHQDSNYRFTLDAHDVLMAKAGSLEMPVEFLKKWLKRKDEKVNDENVDAEYDKMLPAAEWQLVKEKLAKDLGVKVEETDLKAAATRLAAQQFAQYGMTNVPDDVVEKYAADFLADEKYRRSLIDRVVEDKLFDAIRAAVTLEEKDVTVDEFNALFKAEK